MSFDCELLTTTISLSRFVFFRSLQTRKAVTLRPQIARKSIKFSMTSPLNAATNNPEREEITTSIVDIFAAVIRHEVLPTAHGTQRHFQLPYLPHSTLLFVASLNPVCSQFKSGSDEQRSCPIPFVGSVLLDGPRKHRHSFSFTGSSLRGSSDFILIPFARVDRKTQAEQSLVSPASGSPLVPLGSLNVIFVGVDAAATQRFVSVSFHGPSRCPLPALCSLALSSRTAHA